jgi:hypothetical protein
VGLAWTGIEHAGISGTPAFGWTPVYSAVTQNGATLTITPLFDYTAMKFRYIATQGDRLQVFLLQFVTTTATLAFRIIPFDYENKVTFDTDNPPLEVYVGTLLSGFRTTSMANG